MEPTIPHDIRAVVFDLDGLMFNTEDIFSAAGTELLQRRGLQFTDEIRTQMMGRRAVESFSKLVEMTGLTETIDELMTESQEIFDSLLQDHLAPMPGLRDLLDLLDEKRLPKGVATSSGRAYLENILGRFKLMPRFDMTLTAEDVTQGKPHPEVYLKAADRLGVAPEQMLVLEDSEMGTRAAAAAKAIAVSVPHDHSQSHNFECATLVIKGLHDPQLLRIIEAM